MPITWTTIPFTALAAHDLQAIHIARQTVFLEEQSCAGTDADNYDFVSHHLCCWGSGDAGGRRILAYLRIVPPESEFAEPSLGRVLTTAEGRGRGLGRDCCGVVWPNV